jgi:hypothetical protein
MQRWIERPEARWAFWAGIVGALSTAGLATRMILSHPSSSAAFGFVLVPLVAIAVAVPIGIWGAALGHVVLHLRGRAPEPKIVFWAALVAAASLPAALGVEIHHGLALEHAVAEVRQMTGFDLEMAFGNSPWRRDKYFLGALVQNPAASAALLARIAALEDPALAEPMGSLWDVMGDNRKGEPVLALAARHRNATESVKRRAPSAGGGATRRPPG